MQDVYIIDGDRTPFLKAQGEPNPFSASDLAVSAAKALLLKLNFDPKNLGEVITGCVAPSADEANIGRIIALRIGCGFGVPGWTVQRNCASGLQAIDSLYKDIACQRHDTGLAIGTEAMSRTPLLFGDKMVQWLSTFGKTKTFSQKMQQISRFRPHFLKPVISLLKGLTDPVVAMSMGQTAEKLAYQFGITRQEMDRFAVDSHLKVANAYDQGMFENEVIPIFDWKGRVFNEDNGLRRDSKIEKLAKLKPVFDKPYGSVTAGNSSQVTDGAACLLLASKVALKRYKLSPMAKIIDIAWSGLDPTIMGLGPAYAIAKILKNNKLQLQDIDFIEMNEAFAAQVIACLRALNDQQFCQEQFGVKKAFGDFNTERLNVNGGAIALGHPVGASGARITMHLSKTLQKERGNLGIATLCIGGGQGGAILVEQVQGGA